MSFITKRERVFNEYDLFDLPARNEGKLKAYASCTDARAWSHFCSDKTEHLVDIIKRNNETCRPKYIPTDVIVDTLMVAKNAEIARLKHRIAEFEQMLAAYDQLELTCDQKCEIVNAHAAIKAANKELDDLCFDLDLSGFTEGIDSEAFETGKSRGDETPRFKEIEWCYDKDHSHKMETKSNQVSLSCTCDASILVTDPRIEEFQETIIAKDAKLNAMQNTIAVLENDVCEPYCIYAHIYTALEKIFGILCQNDKYKQYLGLLTAGKDTTCIDIKGKILFKMKVLEKFGLALIAPCSQDINRPSQDCSCCRAEIVTHVETSFALTSSEAKTNLDSKRAQLVADIMENEEMKEILSKESCNEDFEVEHTDNGFEIDNCSIETENIKRLKNLQENFDDLLSSYEKLKHEKVCLQIKCKKYEELEKELDTLRNQLLEYNTLWNEKEYYKKRSLDLDSLKEKYLVLTEETSNLEVQVKAEAEINLIKSSTIEDLRCENILLEKKLNEAAIKFEKEKNVFQCKLKEDECKIMCQEQQIKSLSIQIDRLLEEEQNKDFTNKNETEIISLLDEIESLKEEIKNLKETLFCNDEEKQQLHQDFQNNLQLITELKIEIEDWKCANEKILQRNEYLETYTDSFRDEAQRLIEENKKLSQDVAEKSTAIENLMSMISSKSEEIQRLMDELYKKNNENRDLCKQLDNLRETYNNNILSLENEKNNAMNSLHLFRKESQELLDKVKDYDDIIHKQKELKKSLEIKTEDYEQSKHTLAKIIEENKILRRDLSSREKSNAIMKQEFQELHEINMKNMKRLEEEKSQCQQSLDIIKKESEVLKNNIIHFEDLSNELQELRVVHNKVLEEKNKLENELAEKNLELDKAINSIHLSRKESKELLEQLNNNNNSIKLDYEKLHNAYHSITAENQNMQKKLTDKSNELESLLETNTKITTQNNILLHKQEECLKLELELKKLNKTYEKLLADNKILEVDKLSNIDLINKLNKQLQYKIEENERNMGQIKTMEQKQAFANNTISILQNENARIQNSLHTVKQEQTALIEKLRQYEALSYEFTNLKEAYDQIRTEKEKLEIQLELDLNNQKQKDNEIQELTTQVQNLMSHNEDLEQAVLNARTELITNSAPIKESYTDLVNEMTKIKKEKVNNQTKIRDLLDKLEKSENVISNLSEEILARDDKITILENYINELKHEIKKLHIVLDNVIDTGKQIKDQSYHEMDQSLKSIEAHHSKATQSMQLELTKLEKENKLMEEELSKSKIFTEKSFNDKNEYCSQVVNLQNEREMIITAIKELEIKSVGDSTLSPNNSSKEEVFNSIDRIEKSLKTHNNKTVSLEQTLLKVQTSSQLLLNKTDEAKKIIEQKKQKIISEKEEVIKEKLNMEKQLTELKYKLEKQISNDQVVIKDLEAEILNQKLMMDKINNSRQSYIAKLEEDMQSLKELYHDAMQKVTILQDRISNVEKEKNDILTNLEKADKDLEQKYNEIDLLQNELSCLKSKSNDNKEIQVLFSELCRNVTSQTDKDIFSEDEQGYIKTTVTKEEATKTTDVLRNEHCNVIASPQTYNEVQVLSANIEQSFDYVRNCYKKYKLKQLAPSYLKYYSISGISNNIKNQEPPTFSSKDVTFDTELHEMAIKITDETKSLRTDKDILDIYNKNLLHTNSLKSINILSNTQINKCVVITNESSEMLNNTSLNNEKDDSLFDNKLHKSTDLSSDLFIIYRDSVSNNSNVDNAYMQFELTIENSETSTQELTKNSSRKNKENKNKITQNQDTLEDSIIFLKNVSSEKNTPKPKININLPRVETQSISDLTMTDEDRNSFLSFLSLKRQSSSDTKLNSGLRSNHHSVPSLPSSSNHIKVPYNANISTLEDRYIKVKHSDKKKVVHENKIKNITNNQDKEKVIHKTYNESTHRNVSKTEKHKSPSYHNSSRAGISSLFVESKKHKGYPPGKFGLEYIQNTMQYETNPDGKKSYEYPIYSRYIQSVEMLEKLSLREKRESCSSLTGLSTFKMSSMECKTQTIPSKNNLRSVTDRSVMVKIDNSKEYEKKINDLTKALVKIETDYKKKIEAIKTQYDNNIKCIINEHNQGVNSIQSLHEETLQDIIRIHENEVENLRTMSIEAMRKAEKLEKENNILKTKIRDSSSSCLDADPVKICSPELQRPKKSHESKILTKTDVEAFNMKPESRSLGPCTCSLDINISDTIRSIFEQVDVEQRKMAEHTYLKYIANKILTSNIDTLDAQELSFMHLKVCRTWKMNLSKEEVLQKRIDSLEHELMYKQRHTQQHMAELDRQVAEERRRLQEVLDAVCRGTPPEPRVMSPETAHRVPPPPPPTADKQFTDMAPLALGVRRSVGDIGHASATGSRSKRTRIGSHKAVLVNLNSEARREKKLHPDELPTRLRKSHDRPNRPPKK